jgi:hypothetical protein
MPHLQLKLVLAIHSFQLRRRRNTGQNWRRITLHLQKRKSKKRRKTALETSRNSI